MRIGLEFYSLETRAIAKRLLGCKLAFQSGEYLCTGIIVETEAYLHHDDPACHAYRRMTPRNRVMFGPPGHLYVYTIHNRVCMNIVTQPEGVGAAVLIRALQPIAGLEQMRHNRFPSTTGEQSEKKRRDIDLTHGPGKLCQAMGIGLNCNGMSLVTNDHIWIEHSVPPSRFTITSSVRIGISQGVELPYRYFVDGNSFVSGKASDHVGKRNTAFGISDYQ
jgi:DNA-3-methyladenine glycosylase